MSSERRRIASAATLILFAYGLSRVLGAVRELVIANTFGTSRQLDDYRVAFGVPAVLFVVAPLYVSLIAFGYSAKDHELITELTRILLLQPIFLGAGGMVIGILTAYQRFSAQALAPLFYNGSIIVAAALFAPRFGVTALAVGVVLGALLHLGVQLPALWRTGWRPTLPLCP